MKPAQNDEESIAGFQNQLRINSLGIFENPIRSLFKKVTGESASVFISSFSKDGNNSEVVC